MPSNPLQPWWQRQSARRLIRWLRTGNLPAKRAAKPCRRLSDLSAVAWRITHSALVWTQPKGARVMHWNIRRRQAAQRTSLDALIPVSPSSKLLTRTLRIHRISGGVHTKHTRLMEIALLANLHRSEEHTSELQSP